jgi:hypothetical protein
MSATLQAILFNHRPGDTRTGALNVRRNLHRAAIRPEWQSGINTVADDSVAVYVNDAVDETSLSIQAAFRSTDGGREVEIRAVPFSTTTFPLGFYLSQLPAWLWSAPAATLMLSAAYLAWRDWLLAGGNVLGDVVARRVPIRADGTSGLVPFRLRNVRLRARGAGAHKVIWRWQCRTDPGAPWRDAGVSAHTIYALVSEPTLPWRTEPFTATNTNLPWTDVLRHACTWAQGTRTRADAAKSVTESIYALGTEAGGNLLEYGCALGAPSMYAFPFFNLTAFLDRLRFGPGNGRYVNCTDCAAFVATFANALGCDLWESRMGEFNPFFRCNPFLALGSRRWQEPCGSAFGFAYHEVAWSGDCEDDDMVYDAAVAFSGRTTMPPAGTVPRVAANMTFGRPGAGLYRDWIAAPEARTICHPRPQDRVRRAIF